MKKYDFSEKEEKQHKRNLKKCLRIIERNRNKKLMNDSQGVGVGSGLLIIIMVVLLIGVVWWGMTVDKTVCVRCDRGELLMLKGTLRGFSMNESINRFDIFLGNQTYHFSVWDSDYMKQFIGFDITLKTCYHTDPSGRVQFYEFMSAWINN